jgi:anthranilate synthase component 1
LSIPAPYVVQELRLSARTLRRLAYRYPEHYPVLFDSSSGGELARWSMLAALPQGALWIEERRLRSRGSACHAVPAAQNGFLESLDRWWRREKNPGMHQRAPADLPFAGGFVAFLDYELAAEVEPQLSLPAAHGSPRAFALRVPAALLYDHLSGQGYAVCESAAAGELERLMTQAQAAFEPGDFDAPVEVTEPLRLTHSLREEPPHLFRARVEAALEYIRAGDIYQANLSRPWWLAAAGLQPQAVYERLRRANPAPFAAWARFGPYTILSSSPERLVRVLHDGRVQTRPIAGTRPRSRAPGGDQSETTALMASAKERAEHVMLLDLERNDLGRVCRGGSVRVDEFMITESYAHVHHIVSSVSGELRPDITPVQVLKAVFPGGTITGCPKFRCMQLIAALEGEGRGTYTGALGYMGLDGSMDFNILIRTLTCSPEGLHFRAGAGIVADSDWQQELEETRAKARGLMSALEAR